MGERFHKYEYNGPVTLFNQYIGTWRGETIAQSREKAKSNLLRQCKKALSKSSESIDTGGVNIDITRIRKIN